MYEQDGNVCVCVWCILCKIYEWIPHISSNSIQQITTESAKSSLTSPDLHPNHHSQTKKIVKNGDRDIQVLDRTDKVGDNF